MTTQTERLTIAAIAALALPEGVTIRKQTETRVVLDTPGGVLVFVAVPDELGEPWIGFRVGTAVDATRDVGAVKTIEEVGNVIRAASQGSGGVLGLHTLHVQSLTIGGRNNGPRIIAAHSEDGLALDFQDGRGVSRIMVGLMHGGVLVTMRDANGVSRVSVSVDDGGLSGAVMGGSDHDRVAAFAMPGKPALTRVLEPETAAQAAADANAQRKGPSFEAFMGRPPRGDGNSAA
jgi:hypothetical protein